MLISQTPLPIRLPWMRARREIDIEKQMIRSGVASVLDFKTVTDVVIEDHHPEMLARDDEALRARDQDDCELSFGSRNA